MADDDDEIISWTQNPQYENLRAERPALEKLRGILIKTEGNYGSILNHYTLSFNDPNESNLYLHIPGNLTPTAFLNEYNRTRARYNIRNPNIINLQNTIVQANFGHSNYCRIVINEVFANNQSVKKARAELYESSFNSLYNKSANGVRLSGKPISEQEEIILGTFKQRLTDSLSLIGISEVSMVINPTGRTNRIYPIQNASDCSIFAMRAMSLINEGKNIDVENFNDFHMAEFRLEILKFVLEHYKIDYGEFLNHSNFRLLHEKLVDTVTLGNKDYATTRSEEVRQVSDAVEHGLQGKNERKGQNVQQFTTKRGRSSVLVQYKESAHLSSEEDLGDEDYEENSSDKYKWRNKKRKS
jgi:hypothetical protein